MVGQFLGDPLPSFTLPDLSGAETSLDSLIVDMRGAVVVFWSGVCSHCQRYDDTLNQLATRYPDLALIVVACRQDESVDDLRRTLEARGLEFLPLHDRDRRVTRAWLVSQTPRVFLIDAQRRLHYRGAIDNFKLPNDPEHRPYLESAITHFLAGQPITRQETPSFGCPVESVYYTLSKPLSS